MPVIASHQPCPVMYLYLSHTVEHIRKDNQEQRHSDSVAISPRVVCQPEALPCMIFNKKEEMYIQEAFIQLFRLSFSSEHPFRVNNSQYRIKALSVFNEI